MIRTKFNCLQNNPDYETHTAIITLIPVIIDPATGQELVFWRVTPSGLLLIGNPRASAQFLSGTEYYLDFTPAA